MLKEKIFIVFMIILGIVATILAIINKNITTTLCDITILAMWGYDYYNLIRRDK